MFVSVACVTLQVNDAQSGYIFLLVVKETKYHKVHRYTHYLSFCIEINNNQEIAKFVEIVKLHEGIRVHSEYTSSAVYP